MSGALKRLQRHIAQTPVNGRGYRRYGRALRDEISGYVASRRASGASYARIGQELGIASGTLLNWRDTAHSQPEQKDRGIGFRPVALRDRAEEAVQVASRVEPDRATGGLVVVVAGEVRIEGMNMDELVELVRKLGCLQ